MSQLFVIVIVNIVIPYDLCMSVVKTEHTKVEKIKATDRGRPYKVSYQCQSVKLKFYNIQIYITYIWYIKIGTKILI